MPDCGRAFILLSILNAITRLGLFSHSSGGSSIPVKGDIFSLSKLYFSTTEVVVLSAVSLLLED